MQAQIRQNAEEISEFLSDINKWEENMRKKADRKSKAGKPVSGGALPVRLGAGTIHVETNIKDSNTKRSSSSSHVLVKKESAANHTYDIGYKKWEKFDPDAEDSIIIAGQNSVHDEISVENCPSPTISRSSEKPYTHQLTPASIVQPYISAKIEKPTTDVPKARGQNTGLDAEAVERDRGNEEFRKGNFALAIKAYTKCLGLKARNYVAFSNRAMANLRMKDFVSAESDCNCALSIQPDHIKSIVRRASARTFLGKHRAALADLYYALELDPSSKAVRTDIEKAREQLRQAVSRAPLLPITVHWADDAEAQLRQGPELPQAASLTPSMAAEEPIRNSQELLQSNAAEVVSNVPSEVLPTPPPPHSNNQILSSVVSSPNTNTSGRVSRSSPSPSGSNKKINSAKSQNKSKMKSSGTGSTSSMAMSGYELERLAASALVDESARCRLVGLDMKFVLDAIARLQDPAMLCNVLCCVVKWYQQQSEAKIKGSDFTSLLLWLETAAQIDGFSLLYALMDEQHKQQLQSTIMHFLSQLETEERGVESSGGSTALLNSTSRFDAIKSVYGI